MEKFILSNKTFKQKAAKENNSSNALPSTLSYEVTFREIQNDIIDYSTSQGIEFASQEYDDLLYSFIFSPPEELSDVKQTYYSAYASVYFGRNNFNDILDKSINQIREENIALEASAQASIEQQSEPHIQIAYNLEAAQEYASAYAMVNNYSYPEYGADCTNFASQILFAGGFNTTSLWNIWAGPGTIAWQTWVNAGAFCTYWGDHRGYIGKTCTSLAEVNKNSKPGDFLVWRNKTTLEYEHTQFVQTKVNGYIYCTQHSPSYYRQRLSDRITDAAFNNSVVYQLNFN
ncbi:hypothetical protein I230019B6_09980 [Firmicutes bacterium i23-0019-B6]